MGNFRNYRAIVWVERQFNAWLGRSHEKLLRMLIWLRSADIRETENFEQRASPFFLFCSPSTSSLSAIVLLFVANAIIIPMLKLILAILLRRIQYTKSLSIFRPLSSSRRIVIMLVETNALDIRTYSIVFVSTFHQVRYLI